MNSKKHPMLFPWLLVFYEILVYLSMDAYVPALPKISQDLSISAGLAQSTAIVWMVGGLLVQFIFGPLSDRYGRRPILLYGGILYVVTSFACAMAPNIHVLLVARFFQGMAMPAMYIAGYAAINELYDSQTAIKILARMNGITIIAPAFGPLLGGALLLFIDWRWLFVLLGLGAAIAITFLFFKMPETVSEQQQATPFKLSTTFSDYWQTSKNLKFIGNTLTAFLPIIGLVSWILAGPFLIVHRFHYSTLDFGLIQILVFGCFVIGTKVVAKFSSDTRNHIFINTGLILGLIGSSSASLLGWFFPNSLAGFIFSIMIAMLGVGFSLPILSRHSIESSDAPMGIRVTVFSVFRIGAGVFGSICMAIFYNSEFISIALIMLTFTAVASVIRIMITK